MTRSLYALLALPLLALAACGGPSPEEEASSSAAQEEAADSLAAAVYGLSKTCEVASTAASNVGLAATNDAEVVEMLSACADVEEFEDALAAYPDIIGSEMSRSEIESWILDPLCADHAGTPVCLDLATG